MDTEAPNSFYVLMCHYSLGASRAVGVYSIWRLAKEAGEHEWAWVRKTHVHGKHLQESLPMEHNQCPEQTVPVPYYSIDSFFLNDDPDA
jgi:hypothetical protein